MPLLCAGKFTDGDLQIRSETSKETGVKVYSVEHDQNRPSQCFGDVRDETNSWDWDDVDSFVLRQWTFFAVIFENNCFRYTIHRERPLPYVDLGMQTAERGHFGQAFKVGLRADHIKSNFRRYFYPELMYNVQIPYGSMPVREVAVKKLRLDGATDKEVEHFFETETSTLETIRRSLQHSHLTEFISAYEEGADRCFVFPWAPGGNLHEFWRRVRGIRSEGLLTASASCMATRKIKALAMET
ncbi:putative tol-like protein [Diaporthe ampelina]|uniref:Putative tol-like protein n=1 Tax=Diaporthe ampelina TaxID=1214573 RepID=A0A0G2FDM7_9PEZI|nr:putative tol-like protein [Diaporthe ampelina]